jgi:PAS domain S-box-containing protein
VTWSSGRWRSTVDDPRLAHVAPAPHFPRWAEILSAGEVLSSHVRDLPEAERQAMALTDSLSVIAVPIFVDGSWWGFIAFEDCEQERVWSPAETDALRAAAGLIAAAVNRDGAEQGLRRRDAVLEAVSHSAKRLVAEPSWRDAAPALLQELGEATEASRAYLFQTGVGPDGRRVGSQRFEWVAAGITPQLENELLQDMSFEEVGMPQFEQYSERNEIFSANVVDLPATARELLGAQDIRSLITVPIFVHGEWWGFIGFDDCFAERAWSPAETEALRTAASLIEAAIERERSEVVLREHEQKLRAVFDTALDAIFITDDDRRYVDVNPAACEYLGVAKRDLIGRRVDEFLPPHKLATVDEDWNAYLAGGPLRAEWESQRSDGTIVTAEASARPNFLPGLHIAFFRDVTARKQLEAELLNAQKLESLGRLAGGVAHDFNNLLTGISGYASLVLERANGDAELTRDVGEIKRAADRAAELTKQLLAFGRRQMFKPRPLDLNAVLSDVASLLRRLVGDQIELVVRPDAELGVVQADPGQVEQVIVNLVVNARDALPAGGRVTIETRNADDDWVELIVADDGVGMDEDTRSQVFEPFYTTRDEGVGLGLASVYGIVHQSGGEVLVESDPGAGATFTIRLPRVCELAEAEPPPANSAETRRGSETVLLVEDEDVVRDLARRVLERHGYTVFACSHGAEAVELSATHQGRIDLLLTDVVMPGLRGYEVARKVVATRPDIKVLYMSGYAEEALGGGPAVGGASLIEKPFAIDALARRVREVLEPASG